jgi:hypothetical protein
MFERGGKKEKGKENITEVVNIAKVHYTHVCTYHDKIPSYS